MAIPVKREHFWPLMWGATALALLVVLVLEHQFGRSGAGGGPRGPARIAEAKLLPAFRLPEPQANAETLDRPLFVPGRRPSPPAAAGSGTLKRGQFVLQGTTLVGTLGIAFLKEISSGTVHRVEKGGEIQGMKLEEVSPERVVLRSGDDSETLPLLVAKTSGMAAAAVERGPFASSAPPAAPPAEASPPAAPAPAPARPTATPRTAISPRAGQVAPSGGVDAKVAAPEPAPTTGQAEMTPEEMIARRRAARRGQQFK